MIMICLILQYIYCSSDADILGSRYEKHKDAMSKLIKGIACINHAIHRGNGIRVSEVQKDIVSKLVCDLKNNPRNLVSFSKALGQCASASSMADGVIKLETLLEEGLRNAYTVFIYCFLIIEIIYGETFGLEEFSFFDMINSVGTGQSRGGGIIVLMMMLFDICATAKYICEHSIWYDVHLALGHSDNGSLKPFLFYEAPTADDGIFYFKAERVLQRGFAQISYSIA